MAGSDEWRCAAATAAPGRSATFRLERAGPALDAFVVNHDGQYRAYVNICLPLTLDGDPIVVRFPVER
jgi:nitrite reductase/ring-hydroxylating ferredoxin subunit